LLEDYGPNDDPIKITNLGTEILFDVNGPRTTFHGGNLIYTNFPDSSYYIEVEHHNSRSSPDDGVYINIGYPDCCKNVTKFIDTVSCEKIVLNGKTITTSGSYSDTIRVNNCDSINNYVITILNKPIFSLGNDTVICEGETFILKSSSDLTKWSNGSIGKEVVIDRPGIFWGEINTICGVIRDSVTAVYRALPMLELGPDRQICPSDVDTIWANDPNTIWHDGSTGSFFIINKEGIIKATILDFCGNLSDSLVVSYYKNSILMLPEDTLICEGDSIVLSSTSDSTIWSTGTKGKNIVVKKSGLYWGEIKNICGISRDSINILYTSKPILELGPDLQICPNHIDTIWSNNPNTIWHDGSIGSFFIIKQEGLIKAKLSNFCGEINDSAFVRYYPSIGVKLPQDTLLCEGDLITLTSTSPTTQWSTGDIGNSIIVSTSGLYWAEIKNTCGLSRDSIHIYFQNKPNLELGKDVKICPNESDTIWSNDPNTLWHDGSKGPYFIAKKEGTIIAYLSNFCGDVSDSIKVSYYPNSNVDLGPDTTICEGTILTLNSGSSSSVWFDNTSGSSHQITKAGIYWVSIVSPCGLISDTIQIKEMKIYEKPYLPNDTFVCEGINIHLSIPIIDELWNKQFLNNIDINKPGAYWYEFKDNCNNLLDTIEVFYDSIPNEFPSEHLIFCGQDEFNFSTGDPRTEWSNGTIGSGISINKSGIYSFIISNSCGIFIDSISLEFIENNGLYIPNVFSPNGDQVNDVFPGIQFTEDFDIEIYDRWGSRLFESSNKHWNGTFKSQDVPPGVYAYIIRSKACKHKIKYGNITLVR
jgi:gliding motility-associated-like protein